MSNIVRIALGSDLHLRRAMSSRYKNALNFPENADVIVLAGDIGVGHEAAEIVSDVANDYPLAEVIWVSGNHEFYHGNTEGLIEHFQKCAESHERIHFLENEAVTINGVRFIGATLWSDFTILGNPEEAKTVAANSINDFVYIKTGDQQHFTPDHAAEKFRESVEFIESELAQSQPAQSVVITHFPPGLITRNEQYPLDPLTAYFQANVEDLIRQYQPRFWLYGHNHYSKTVHIDRTEIVSHQLGYRSEAGRIPPYTPNQLLHIEKPR